MGDQKDEHLSLPKNNNYPLPRGYHEMSKRQTFCYDKYLTYTTKLPYQRTYTMKG